ncbi:MAG: diadenylate cyclase CdaA [bacterium]
MLDSIINFFNTNEIANLILDFYFVFIIVFFLVRFFSKSKLAFSLVIPIGIFSLLAYISKEFSLVTSETLFYYVQLFLVLASIVLLAPDFRKFLQEGFKQSEKTNVLRTTNDNKNAIADAMLYLSSKKIGALVTIEKHRLLDQYSEKAIQMDSDISKELLINIFSPLTPLHDGAVIIKGNKIRCAGAYYVLSQRDNLDKTVGSRHRAALGIAEVTDSVTIVVSEETGSISIAYSGIFMKMNDKDQLLEYIDLAMEREV